MRRIDTVDELFAAGNPATSTKGSPVRYWWLNALQEELAGVVEGLGGTLDPEDNGQLFDWLVASFAMKSGSAAQLFRAATAEGASDVVPLAQLESLLAAISANQSAGAFRNLKLSATGASATVSVTADQIAVESVAGDIAALNNVALAISGAAAGANGLDTGVLAASTWYSVWAIWDGTTTAGLLSLSATAPTMPAGYTHKMRLGWVRTDGTANKYPLGFTQRGRNVQWLVGAGINVTNLPIMATGIAGSLTTPTWIAVGISNYVPSTAAAIEGVLTITTSGAMVAPNNSYGAQTSTTNPPFVGLNASSGVTNSSQFKMILESTNIYWASAGAGGVLAATGWEDNI